MLAGQAVFNARLKHAVAVQACTNRAPHSPAFLTATTRLPGAMFLMDLCWWQVVRSGGLGEPSDVAHTAMGAAAGALAGALTNPLDVVRTQATMRTWGGEAATSSLSLLPRIFAEQGVRGLMAGSMARSAYIGLGAAAFFVAYENSLKIMER